MKNILKQINSTKVHLDLSIAQALELKNVLDKDVLKDALPSENGCKCPNCGDYLFKDKFYCPLCGQRVRYIESDVIPL